MTISMKLNGLGGAKPHFVLVPFLAQGHMIPMVDMACLIADRGALVSFITTPINAARINPIIDRVRASGLPVRFVELELPCKESGLPEGCENMDLITSGDMYLPFFNSLSLLQRPLELYLREQKPSPTCIISDSCQPWTMNVAEELNIRRFIFYGPSCFFSLCIHNIRVHKVYANITDESELVTVPGLPHRITTTKAQTPIWFDVPAFEEYRDSFFRSEEAADGVVVNTFRELESEYVELYEKTIGKKVWPIGPLSLYNKDIKSKATRGKKASIDERCVLDWLDTKEPGSVIFVSFGSLARTCAAQVIEIGCGLEASDGPFIWVIREGDKCEEVSDWMSRSGFEERTRGRGLIILGWAPQVVILSHPSVGGFMTHCGWNSMLEAVSAGVPMITLPHFGDQFINEKLIVEVLEVGVSLGVKEAAKPNDRGNVRVARYDVKNALVNLMDADGGKEGEERRARARVLREMAQKAMEEGGSSYENLTHMIKFINT